MHLSSRTCHLPFSYNRITCKNHCSAIKDRHCRGQCTSSSNPLILYLTLQTSEDHTRVDAAHDQRISPTGKGIYHTGGLGKGLVRVFSDVLVAFLYFDICHY